MPELLSAIRFGSYGVGRFDKGTDTFFRLAEEVQSAKTTWQPTFTQIGYALDKQLMELPYMPVNILSRDVPLDQEAYEKYSRSIDYALFLDRPNAYELRASAAILDAFSSLKPIIALKSPLSEYYFKKMGDIWYLCENYNAARDTVLDILQTRPIDRYRQQQENILTRRVQVSPAGVFVRFRNLLKASRQKVDI